jgi:hypothetical protein
MIVSCALARASGLEKSELGVEDQKVRTSIAQGRVSKRQKGWR